MVTTIAQASAPPSETLRWYVLQTKPHQEGRAEANLATLGLEVLLPQTRVPRLSPRRDVRVEALFPSYLFVRFDVATAAGRVRNTRGVARILGSKEGPTSVDDAIVEEIRSRIGDDGFVKLAPFGPGDTVRITAGVLRDFVGVFEPSTHPTRRIRILLSTLNSQIRVTVDNRYVARMMIAS
jgi:transcriptional antiterminator RfaH